MKTTDCRHVFGNLVAANPVPQLELLEQPLDPQHQLGTSHATQPASGQSAHPSGLRPDQAEALLVLVKLVPSESLVKAVRRVLSQYDNLPLEGRPLVDSQPVALAAQTSLPLYTKLENRPLLKYRPSHNFCKALVFILASLASQKFAFLALTLCQLLYYLTLALVSYAVSWL